MLKLEEALDILIKNIKSLNVEKISLLNSFNRILSDDIYSPIDLPAFDKATVNGYAARYKNTLKAKEGNPIVLRIIDKVYPGYSSKFRICQGESVKISKGGVIPEGADTVILMEHTKEDRGKVKVYKSMTKNENCCLKGKYIKKNDLVLKKHIVIKEEHIRVLSSLGIDAIKVYKKPVIGVFSVGDDLIDIGKAIRDGKEYSDIPYYLYCKIKSLKGFARLYPVVQEEKIQIERNIKEAEIQCDIIVIISELEMIRTVLEKKQYNILFSNLKVEDDELVLGACKNNRLVIGLQCQRESKVKSFNLLVKPLIEHMFKTKL